MRTYYNRIAGQSPERLAALSDGIFAVAMTLLVLDLHAPVINIIQHPDIDAQLLTQLQHLLPNFLTYLMSFLTLGIFWVGQQTQLNRFVRSDRDLTWIHLAYLLAVSLLPFSTALLAADITSHVAILVYWFDIFLLGVTLYASIRYAWHAGLLKEEVDVEVRKTNERRIIIAQTLYAFGAALCFINTSWSIAFIFLVQLNYAIAPRIPFLRRL